jgi:hypothetical protein
MRCLIGLILAILRQLKHDYEDRHANPENIKAVLSSVLCNVRTLKVFPLNLNVP